MQQVKPQAGMRLGNYSLTVKLGRGIFSETWLAEHLYLEGKEICLKVFTNDKYCNHLIKQKFLPVVKAPDSLPNLEDFDPNHNPPYLAQEMVTGRSLRQILREKSKFRAEEALEMLGDIVVALKKLHDKKQGHLDLRPAHVIIHSQGGVKLLDYALGKVTTLTISEFYKDYTSKQTSSLPKPIMRSLVYKSKRQRTGFQFDPQADIFALGILLFEMVTGGYPNRKAAFPSSVEESLPTKIDQIYAQCCGRGEDAFQNLDQLLQAISAENIQDTISNLEGVQLLSDISAIVSVTTLAGEKNFVDGKNIMTLSKNLDEIIASKLRFIALDFSSIDYINSSAVGFLVNFSDRLQKIEGAMVMFTVDKKVMTILSALGLDSIFKIVEDVQQAQQYLILATQKYKDQHGL